MHSSTDKAEAVFLYVIHNVPKYKKAIYPYKVQRDFLLKDTPELKEDILKEFENLVRTIVLNDVSVNLQLNPEEIVSFVQGINIDELLK